MLVRVQDAEDGRPIEGARISLQIASESLGDNSWTYHEKVFVGKTAPSGTLDLGDLHHRRYLVDAEAPGYVRHRSAVLLMPKPPLQEDRDRWRELIAGRWKPEWEKTLAASPLAENLLPVVPPEGSVSVTLRLPRARILGGAVRDKAGRPLPRAKVSILSHGVVQSSGSEWSMLNLDPDEPVFTDGAGTFVLSAYSAGLLTIRAEAEGFVYEQKDVDLESSAVPSLDFVLAPSASLRGRVLGPSGAPEPDATVAAFVPAAGGRIFHTTTDADGRFQLDQLDPKPLVVVAWAFFRGACSCRTTPAPEPLDLVLEATRPLHGRVVDQDGRPLQGAMVTQHLILREADQAITLGRMQTIGPKGFVSNRLPGLLNVGVPIQEPFCLTNADGTFTLETVLDDRGKVQLQIFQSSPDNHHKTSEWTAELGRPLTILFHPGSDRGDPGDTLQGIYAEPMNRRLQTADEFARRAGFRLANQDWRGALQDLTEAIALLPSDADLFAQRASCFSACSRIPEAIADFTEALRLRPEDAGLYYFRALTYAQASETRKAIADLTESIRIAPAVSKVWVSRSSARLAGGDSEGALADAVEALRLEPDDPSALIARASARERLGDLQAALEDCTRSIARRPQAYPLQTRARIRRALGDPGGALEDLEAALEDVPMFLREWREHLSKEIAQLRTELGRP